MQRISLIIGALLSLVIAIALVRVDLGQRQHVDRDAVQKYAQCRSVIAQQFPNLGPDDLAQRCANLEPDAAGG